MDKKDLNLSIISKYNNLYKLQIKKIGNDFILLATNQKSSEKYKTELNFNSKLMNNFSSIDEFFRYIVNYTQRNEINIDDKNNKKFIELKIKKLQLTLKYFQEKNVDNDEINEMSDEDIKLKKINNFNSIIKKKNQLII